MYIESLVKRNTCGLLVPITANEARTLSDTPPVAHASSLTTYGLSASGIYGHVKPAESLPLSNSGIGSVGVAVSIFARADHRHPEITSVLQASRLVRGSLVGLGGGVIAPAVEFTGESDLILQVSHVNSDYLEGLIPFDCIPTGTTSSTVAAGNHTHLYAGSATAGGPATTALACTGNAATATKLAAGVNLTVGNTAKSFDGSTAISWTLAEIGAAPTTHNHDSTYLKLSGGTLTGSLSLSSSGDLTLSKHAGLNRLAYFDASGKVQSSASILTTSFSKTNHDHDSTYLKLTGGTITGDFIIASGSRYWDYNTGWDSGKIPYFVSGQMVVGTITKDSCALASHSHALADLPKLEAGTLIMGTGSSTALGTLARGANGQFLSVVSNQLAWVDAPSGGSAVSPANPTASVGLAAVNGSAATFMRSDAAPKLDVSISPTWTGTHTFNGPCQFNGGTDLLPSGTNGQFLSLVGGAPAWVNAPSGGGGRARNFRAMTASGAINHTSGTDTLILVGQSGSAVDLELPTSAAQGDVIEFYASATQAFFTCAAEKIWPLNPAYPTPGTSGALTDSWGDGNPYIGTPAHAFALWDGAYWRVWYLNIQY